LGEPFRRSSEIVHFLECCPMSQMGAVSQARQVAYNIVALKTGQPKSPSGANEQH